MNHTLIVLVGPTGIGKTDLSIQLATYYNTAIVSSDSRQVYREMRIGTAVPDDEQLSAAPHYFIGTRSIHDDYTAGRYEVDALQRLEELFTQHNSVLLVGGSGLYIDAVCRGIDEIPPTDSGLRAQLVERLEREGVESLRFELARLDPDIIQVIDIKNPKRVLRALEVCLTTGQPYSELRTNFSKTRDFNIIKIGLQIPRNELYNRINRRVDLMMSDGLLDEARQLYPYRHLNALKTVGYRELFDYFDGKTTLEEAVDKIKQNTRHYAKRQISWFARYSDIKWFCPAEFDKIIRYIGEKQKL